MKKLLVDGTTMKLQLVESSGTGYSVARGEFGRCDVPTENRRIYPRALWEREIKRIKQAVKEGKVLGELDHPCLTSNDFRVLTLSGWKEFSEIKVGDKVWSRVNGEAVLSDVKEIIDQPYSGPAIKVQGRSIDSTFTPNHKFLIEKRPDRGVGTEAYATIAEIAQNFEKHSHDAIPKTAKFFSESPKFFRIPGVEGSNRFKNDVSEDLLLDSNVFAAFLGIYLAEGYCATTPEAGNYGVFIAQKNEWSRNYIYEEILSKFPEDLKWTEQKTGFCLIDARLHSYLSKLGDQYVRYIPEEVKKLGHEALTELLFWFCIGDGRMVSATGATCEDGSFKQNMAEDLRGGHVTNTRRSLFSVSERLVRDLHECLTRTGQSGTISKIVTEKDYEFAGHIIKAENKVTLYQLNFSSTKHIWLSPLSLDTVHHDGNIYCLSVTNGNFYMEQNGKSFWTGNSDGKTSLKRVSHVITDLHITEDGQIIGEAKILDNEHGRQLQSILKAGGAVGVSSRGMGSTSMNEDGYEVVQEDFSYMTHDFVADPAVKTSYPAFQSESKELEGKVLPAGGQVETQLQTVSSTEAKATEAAAQNTDEVVSGVVSAVTEAKKPKEDEEEEKEGEEKAEKDADVADLDAELEPEQLPAADMIAGEEPAVAGDVVCKCEPVAADSEEKAEMPEAEKEEGEEAGENEEAGEEGEKKDKKEMSEATKASKYVVTKISSEIYEDSYTEGEGAETGAGLSERVSKTFASKEEMLKWLESNYGISSDFEEERVERVGGEFPEFVLQTSRGPLADHSEAQNGGWMEATDKEIELWKKGEMKLYVEHFTVHYHQIFASEESKNFAASTILSEVAKMLMPFFAKEDVAEQIKGYEAKLTEANEKLAKALAEAEAAKASAVKAAKVARDLGLHLHMETAVRGTTHEKAVRELIGDVTKFESHEHLLKAVNEAKTSFVRIEEEAAKKSAEGSEQVESLKQDLEATKGALKEATDLAKKYALKAYVMECVKGHPNASKILTLAESAQSKADVDMLIKRHSVEPTASKEYNSIRNRFSKLGSTSLVEDSIKSTGTRMDVKKEVSPSGVDREFLELFGTPQEQLIEL